ncbi:MAG TPA: protein kinase [Kofleriaceae bacterium]|nr:protein kinase [Kofleriaceae bacterium]
MPAEGAGIRFGQYVLLRRLARGGMAEVFLAQQHGLEGFDRRVAVKRILPHLADAPDFIKMFLSEARLAAQLTHPNIVHIYDFGKVETDYFIAMEFVDGVHAGELFKHGGETDRLSPTMIARIGADAAAALHYAHELRAPNGKPFGLVHRDVSPANLMVTFDGAVKLCDFGIAKAAALGEKLTIPGHVKGKYAYMSPEQTTGSPLDGRSDVYALAIVLWELISGKTIVPRGDAIEAMRAIRDGKLTPIDRVAPWTPPPLANAITWALQTNRDQRPTAMQLAQELEAFIKSSPELATPLQLGSWLRVRFQREQTGEAGAYPAGGTQGTPGTLAAPSTQSHSDQVGEALGSLDSGSLGSGETTGETTSETRAIALSDRLAEAATVIAGDRPRFEPGTDEQDAPAPRTTPMPGRAPAPEDDEDDEDHDDTGEPNQQPDSAETVLRSGAFRAQIPSGPLAAPTLYPPRPRSPTSQPAPPTLYDPRAKSPTGPPPVSYEPRPRSPTSQPVAPTLYDPRAQPRNGPPPLNAPNVHVPSASAAAQTLLDSRPAVLMRQSPLGGVPAIPGRPPFGPPPAAPSISRRALAIGGLIGIAVLSFIISLAVRGNSAPSLDGRSFGMTSQGAIDAPAPVDAPPPPPPPPIDAHADATRELPPTIPIDAPAPPDAAAPDAGATTVLEVRTRPDGAKVTIGDQSLTSPAQFTLPAGHYAIDAEHDGWIPEHRELDLVQNTRVVQDVVFTQHRAHSARPPTGKLTVRTTPPCEVYLGTRRLTETPFVDLELETGSYTLQFKHPSHQTVFRTVIITAGKTTKLQFPLP